MDGRGILHAWERETYAEFRWQKRAGRRPVLGTEEGIILKLLLNRLGRYELASSGLAWGQWRAVVTMVMILQVPEIPGTFS